MAYKRLSEEVRRRVETAIEMLLSSEDPRKEGHMLQVLGKAATHMR